VDVSVCEVVPAPALALEEEEVVVAVVVSEEAPLELSFPVE
jgi:hypothetical protein